MNKNNLKEFIKYVSRFYDDNADIVIPPTTATHMEMGMLDDDDEYELIDWEDAKKELGLDAQEAKEDRL